VRPAAVSPARQPREAQLAVRRRGRALGARPARGARWLVLSTGATLICNRRWRSIRRGRGVDCLPSGVFGSFFDIQDLAPEPVGFKVVAFRVEAEWEPGGQRPLAGSCAFERMYLRLFPAEDGARDREVDNPLLSRHSNRSRRNDCPPGRRSGASGAENGWRTMAALGDPASKPGEKTLEPRPRYATCCCGH